MKSPIHRIFCSGVLAIMSFTLTAQTADEVIARHIDAHGGADRWNSVEALKITGKFTAFSLENDFMCIRTNTGSYYADLHLGEKHVIESLHEGEGWTIDPWQEMDYARRLNSGEENALAQKAEFFTPFFNYQVKGHSVEYSGMDTVDGLQMHKLLLTRVNGKTETWYLNADTYLEYKCESDWVDFAQTVPAETYFDDFREVEGLILPFFVERTFWQRDRILLVKDVEINPGVDPSIFTMPRRKEMENIAFLQGTWDVAVEAWTRMGTWYTMGATKSTIDFISPNMLQEKITYERVFLISKIRNFSYNEAGGNYRVSEYDEPTTVLSVFEGVLTDTSFVFDDTKIQYSGGEPDVSPKTRYVVSMDEEDGFVIERLGSTDGGETWGPRDRFTYTRK